eukprot:3107111-Prymnesium_polylepis.2
MDMDMDMDVDMDMDMDMDMVRHHIRLHIGSSYTHFTCRRTERTPMTIQSPAESRGSGGGDGGVGGCDGGDGGCGGIGGGSTVTVNCVRNGCSKTWSEIQFECCAIAARSSLMVPEDVPAYA